jgi:GntR family transcriptional repressor for pyruvate dehydrogenase complex
VLDLLEVRECLEGQAAWLAATRALPADVVKMREAALKVEKCITQGQTYFRPNVEFHMAVAGAAHNSALTESLRCLLGEVRDFRERLMREITGITSRDLGEHRAILQAIESHNPAGARRSMVRHIRKFAALVQEFTGQPVRGAAVSHPGRNR